MRRSNESQTKIAWSFTLEPLGSASLEATRDAPKMATTASSETTVVRLTTEGTSELIDVLRLR